MRCVEHLPIQRRHPPTPKGRDHCTGVGEVGFGWGEGGVDHRDLVEVDCEAAGEALAGGAFSVGSETLQLAKSA